MTLRASFGPSGNSRSFTADGNKHSYQAPAWLASRGLDAYEYSAGNGVTGSIAAYAKIGEEAKKHGISLSFHSPYYISLSSAEPELREKSITYIQQSAAAARAMGADIIVVHTGSAAKLDRAQALTYTAETIMKALDTVELGEVKIGLETLGKKNQLGTLGEVIELCRLDRERLRPVVDFGHLNSREAGGVFVTADDYRRVFSQIAGALGAEYAERLHCHFSKIEYTQAGEKKHLTFEDTVFGPDYRPLMEAIAADGLAPRIICESQGTMAEDALEMKNYYMSLAR